MTAESGQLIRLKKAHINPASRMMARAFQNYPINVHVYPDAAEREARLPYMFEYHLRYCLTYKLTYTTSDQLEGLAIWMRLEKISMSYWRYISSGAFWPVLKMGREAKRRAQPFFEFADKKHKELAPFTHWYLMLIGVDPKFQGKGYSSLLMKEMFSRIDEEGLPCYLETQVEKNVSIYQRFGFKIIDEFTIPETTIMTWAMLRDSQPISK
ncbi:GNAT family N-acetyltransferase [Chloroflexota bacterium]